MLNKYSKNVTQDPSQPAAQAMLHAIGLTDDDFKKPFVGIASTGYEGNPCNMHLNDLSTHIKTSINNSEIVGLIFNTIGVSDGISMGTFGMRYSLPSRDIIADSIETVVQAMSYDGLVTVVGCDKNMPGALMAMLRLNRPSILVYGGTIDSGCYKNKELDVVSAFEAWGEKVAGQIDETEFKNVIKNACPGPGACGGMYTANTMASAIEALGMSLPFNSSNPATSQNKIDECKEIGNSIKSLIENDIKPLDIVTLKSLENALRLVTVLGGSTNAVLHFLAIAKAANIDVSIDYFQQISDSTPFLANLKPSGKYLMKDLHEIGGIPSVLMYMLENKMINGDCLTVTGKTIEENLSNVKSLDFSNDEAKELIKQVQDLEHKGFQFEAADGSLYLLMSSIKGNNPDFFTFESFRVFSERRNSEQVVSEAVCKVEVNDTRYVTTGEGVGPVDALSKALISSLEKDFPDVERIKLVDYKVRIIDSTDGTEATTRVLIEWSDGEIHWSTIGVHQNIINASWNALCDGFNFFFMYKK